MTNSTLSLDLVQIASPCHVSWDAMSGDDRRRFCRHCNLHVYNLSDMPRVEAEAFITKSEGRTCIRLFRREDGTVLTRDCPVGLRAIRLRLVRAVAALAGLLLALVSGTVFAGRLKHLNIPGLGRPADAYAEWIEPGSTQPAIMGALALPLSTGPGTVYESQESPLPEPTPKQLQEIAERLTK